jgi:hypothetical protein
LKSRSSSSALKMVSCAEKGKASGSEGNNMLDSRWRELGIHSEIRAFPDSMQSFFARSSIMSGSSTWESEDCIHERPLGYHSRENVNIKNSMGSRYDEDDDDCGYR